MQFHILGAGSLGLLWAGRLARAGHDVHLLMRDPQALERWEAAGSQLILEHDGIQQVIQLSGQLHSAGEPIKHLIMATKAYAVKQALETTAHRIGSDSTVVMLQNGLGSQQYARDQCAGSRVLFASVTDGAWMPGPGHVVWAGKGVTRLGDTTGKSCPSWLDRLSANTLDWVWETDIEQVLWQKLAINCAINPYTVLYDCPNGDVPAQAGQHLNTLIVELQALLASQGYSAQAAGLPQTVTSVIQRTAQNSSSMRQDVHARRRTEIDYILGFALRAATDAGLEVPILTTLNSALETHLANLGLPTD